MINSIMNSFRGFKKYNFLMKQVIIIDCKVKYKISVIGIVCI